MINIQVKKFIILNAKSYPQIKERANERYVIIYYFDVFYILSEDHTCDCLKSLYLNLSFIILGFVSTVNSRKRQFHAGLPWNPKIEFVDFHDEVNQYFYFVNINTRKYVLISITVLVCRNVFARRRRF